MTSAFSILTFPPKKYPNNLLSDTQTQTKTDFAKDTDFINGQIIFKSLPNLSLLNQKNNCTSSRRTDQCGLVNHNQSYTEYE